MKHRSIGGLTTRPGFSGYQPTKTAINRFAEFVHTEYGDKGVRAFSYHPGGVLTKLAEYGMPPELVRTALIDKPELAGGFCVFLTAPGRYADTDVFRGKYVKHPPCEGLTRPAHAVPPIFSSNVKHLEEITAAGYEAPTVNQLELHPFCQQRPIVEYCRAHSIVIQAYCPIVRGKMDQELAEKDPAQVLLRWPLQHGFVPLPKSSRPTRIRSNAALYDFSLTEEDMAKLDELDHGKAGTLSWNPVDVD
ncbi:hypothetical protein EVJ58_g4300 [Rhodofomes roseus]|uniref:NADP-dependent oxidoreductase domain-containing protein n=1 Tax=Rhodofomes roseus TaxID=34475 RepID=A0A4Y9YHE9_9APHY|nr:hypothetical protein EVJ58_g4300 [Rhodofomes roseus]